jgi:hypothetical protein
MDSLDSMLKRAAGADEWTTVVHRCAWCRRTLDPHGSYTDLVSLEPTVVVTDGMCAACGTKALAQIAARHQPLAA